MTAERQATQPIDDPFAHLPKSNTAEYRRGETIYSAIQPSARVYLVTQGKVMVTRVVSEDKRVVMEICQASDIFGESSLVNGGGRAEQAVALENTRVMSWTPQEIVDCVTRQTRLGMALLQALAEGESGGGYDSSARRAFADPACQPTGRAARRWDRPHASFDA
jgi:CRP-like cAMP-binding protein